jgi:Ca-activated chloride channel family protein
MLSKFLLQSLMVLLASGWFVDLWLTADQQGRYAFESGDYQAAAERFEDTYWKGISLYRLGDYEEATNQFALLETAEAYFHLGNCYARLGGYPAAAESYEDALRLRTDFSEAEENRKLVLSLIEKEPEEGEEQGEPGDPNLDPDEVKFDEQGKKGKEGEVEQSFLTEEQVAELWMRNIQTSPANYLRFKFQIQADARKGTRP